MKTLDLVKTAVASILVVSACETPPPAPSQHAPTNSSFHLVELEWFTGAGRARAWGLDDRGNVVGEVVTYLGMLLPWRIRGFYWSNGVMRELTTLPNGGDSRAYGINSAGEIVGTAMNSLGAEHAVVWRPGPDDDFVIQDLGVLPGGAVSRGWGASPSRRLFVGSSSTAGEGPDHAFWRSSSGMVDLGTLPGGHSSEARAANTRWWVVGGATTLSGDVHAFLHKGEMIDLGTLGGADSIAHAISERGAITGSARLASGRFHPFLRASDGTHLKDLGTLPGSVNEWGEGNGVNDWPWVVGRAIGAGGFFRAFLWTEESGMVDLNDLLDQPSDLDLISANAVNAKGQIVGWGYRDGRIRAFLLDPLTTH